MEKMVNVYFFGKQYSVPADLTIMNAMEYAGYTLKRGCGCRHGFCGACATIYRIKGKNELKTCLACQTQVEEGMYAKAMIFFKSIYEQDPNKRYRAISLWLINYHSLLVPNIRDAFSAGGTCKKINGKSLCTPYPHIVKELLSHNSEIYRLLAIEPDEEIFNCINEFWDFDQDSKDLYGSWVSMVETAFGNNGDLKDIPIRNLLESNAKPY